MDVDKKECFKEQTKDGMDHILSSQMILLNNNKDIKIISRQIYKITDKMSDYKK